MPVDRDRLFSDLDVLSVEQIETGLDAGVWGEEARPVVEHYVLHMKLAVQHDVDLRRANETARVAVELASRANLKATAGLIIAAGAMLAAMTAAFIAFLALRQYGWEPPW